MAERSINFCTPELKEAWTKGVIRWKELNPNAPVPFLTCTYRSKEEQDALYAQGRSKPGKKVTNAQAGQSAHNFNPSLALDFAMLNPNKTANWDSVLFIQFWNVFDDKTGRFTYGGNWKSIKDYAHIEVTNWKEITQ